jgi:alpha-N-arabinofuranosidase
LDVTAALTSDGRFLTMAVVNATESAQTLALSMKGIALRRGRMWLMTGPNLDTATGLNRHDLRIQESAINTVPNTLAIAPISISIYEFEKQ